MTSGIHPCAALLAMLAKGFSGTQVRWTAPVPDPRPRIYFANHSSHLDFVVLWAALPPAVRARTRPVAGQDYWESTALRSFLATRVFRSVLVQRFDGTLSGRAILTPMLEALDTGGSLILFPEGTRGAGDRIGEFKRGLYELCRERPALEAVPVYLENLHRILPKGEYLPLPLESRVTFGTPLFLHPGEDHRQFLSRARSRLCELRDS